MGEEAGSEHRCGCCPAPSEAPKGQGRPCLSVKIDLYFSVHMCFQSMFTARLKPAACTDRKKQNCVRTGQITGSWRNSLCKAEHVKCIRVILPKLSSGISGDPRVSDLIIQRPPPPLRSSSSRAQPQRGRSGLTRDGDLEVAMLFWRQVLSLGLLAEEEGLVEVWPWWVVTGMGI